MKFLMISFLLFMAACATTHTENSRTIASIQETEQMNARSLSGIQDPELSDQELIQVD
jgi:hypothetical protein